MPTAVTAAPHNFSTEGPWSLFATDDISIVSGGKGVHIGADGEESTLLVSATRKMNLQSGVAQLVLVNQDPAGGAASLMAGTAGVAGMYAGPDEGPSGVEVGVEYILAQTGIPDLGARVRWEADLLSVMVGPPDLGPSVQIGADWVTVQVGPMGMGTSMRFTSDLVSVMVGPSGGGSSITMTPESIIFKVAEVTFTMTPGGIVEEVAEVTRETTPEGHDFTAAETVLNVGVEGIMGECPLITQETEGSVEDNTTVRTVGSDAAKTDEAGINSQLPG